MLIGAGVAGRLRRARGTALVLRRAVRFYPEAVGCGTGGESDGFRRAFVVGEQRFGAGLFQARARVLFGFRARE